MLIVNFEVRTAFASAIPARNPCLLPEAKRLNEVKSGNKPNGLTIYRLNQFNISKIDLGLLLLLAGLVRLNLISQVLLWAGFVQPARVWPCCF